MVILMVFCSGCGEELPETAYFCLKCGVRTIKGIDADIAPPWNWEQQVEKALSKVGKEMEKAFETVRESIQKSIKREPVLCSNCGEKGLSSAKFCYKCGTKFD